MFWSGTPKLAWQTKILLNFFAFLRQFASRWVYYFSKKVFKMLRYCKHIQFWFTVQSPLILNLIAITQLLSTVWKLTSNFPFDRLLTFSRNRFWSVMAVSCEMERNPKSIIFVVPNDTVNKRQKLRYLQICSATNLFDVTCHDVQLLQVSTTGENKTFLYSKFLDSWQL